MHATPAVPFSALLADTILAHGLGWTWRYLTRTMRMPRWEVDFWMGTPPVGRAMVARAAWERATEAA